MNLYEINESIKNFEFTFDEDTGEVLNLDELDELKLSRNEKVENIALFIKNLKADEKALDDEIKSLQARKKAKQTKIDNLSKYLEIVLGNTKFESARCKLSWRKFSKVIIDNEEDFIYEHPEMVKQEITYKIDKKSLKDYLKNHVSKYAHIEENQNLQIK